MSDAPEHSEAEEMIREEASRWVLQLDRGLSAEEQDAYSQWLAADVRHRRAATKLGGLWDNFDRLAGLYTSMSGVPNPDLLARPRTRTIWRGEPHRDRRWLFRLAAAAAVVGAVIAAKWALNRHGQTISPQTLAMMAPRCEQQKLEDGSVVQLSQGAAVQVIFSSAERRIRLERGEAHFTVAKNPLRPFVVAAPGLEVRAIGTAFDVRLVTDGAEVLVTEGHVKVAAAGAAVDALKGQAVAIRLARARPELTVAVVGAEETAARLAWRPRMLDFTAVPLAEVVAEFNRHNAVQLAVGDDSLKGLKLSAAFRSDNVRGFVRLMEADFEMKAERGPAGEIVLSGR